MTLLRRYGDEGAKIAFIASMLTVFLTFANFMIDFGFALFYCLAFLSNGLAFAWYWAASSRTSVSKRSLAFSVVVLCAIALLAVFGAYSPLDALTVLTRTA